MSKGKIIVVAVRDENHGRIAMQRALHLSQSIQDQIYLVYVERFGQWKRINELLMPSGEWESQDSEDQAWLQKLSESVDPNGPSVNITVLSDEPGSTIAEYASQIDADLVIVTSPRTSQAREIFIGSTALRILRTATCPILVAGEQSADSYKNALVAIDINDAGQRVAHAANTWLPDSTINFAHAYKMPQEGQMRTRGAVSDEDLTKLREFVRIEDEEKLKSYRASFPSATIHMEHGHASSVILDFVLRMRPDILVLGKHRGTSKDERIFGSVTQFLLYHCPTDILLVP